VPKTSDVVAAIDLGSNSFHMKIARAYEGELQVLDRMREMVHLGAGLDDEGNLTRDVQQRALECLARFGERVRAMPQRAVRAVGTNTLRNARNAREFNAAAEKALGHSIKVISGEEEARLIYLGVAHTLADNGQRRLVLDIGGGSTELIIGEHSKPTHIRSLEMGCVSFSMRYFKDGEITAKRMQRARDAAAESISAAETVFRDSRWQHAVGASGTIRAVHNLVREAKWTSDGITRDSVEKLGDAMIKQGAVDKLRNLGLNAERAPVFPGGLAILSALFDVLKLDYLRVSDGALREGMLYDMLGWPPDDDTCTSSVLALANRFHVDATQAARVEQTSLALFDQVRDSWGLNDPQLRRVLAWAAQLHEIGLDIASNQHHKHGAYIAENADLDGFTPFEQRLLAAVVRSQRGKFSAGVWKELDGAPLLQRTALLLRIAVILHRSRSPEPLPRLSASGSRNGLTLKLPKYWIAERPLFRVDFAQEVDYLKEIGLKLELE
jgi:exopolyphosphatase/guanosine-5'-triphosphate,3'-diphosphate pyrophosphatase